MLKIKICYNIGQGPVSATVDVEQLGVSEVDWNRLSSEERDKLVFNNIVERGMIETWYEEQLQ